MYLSKDEIIRMARESGISKPWDQEPVKWETLQRFSSLIAAAEREECVREISAEIHSELEYEAYYIIVELIKRIRVRGSNVYK